jgi:hypothetical protein
MATTAIPTDYCSDCRPLYGLPPAPKPTGAYDACPACDPHTPILSCPQHRSTALAGIASPGNYYYCPACDDEWHEPGPDERASYRDYGMALAALTWLTFQCGVYFTFMLGFVLVLTQNYGHAPDDAIGPAALYAFLFFMFWILFLFPALFDITVGTAQRVWHGIRGQSL